MNPSSTTAEQHDVTTLSVKRVALVGNPNAGKTTLFNALTGLRAKTANYPGITVDVRKGNIDVGSSGVELIDLPGLYSLDSLTPEEEVAAAVLDGTAGDEPRPDAILLVIDATNVERNLFLASEVLDLKRPTVIALSLIDAAEAAGIAIDTEALAARLNCEVVPVSSRTGAGLNRLCQAVGNVLGGPLDVIEPNHTSCTAGCSGCTFAAR